MELLKNRFRLKWDLLTDKSCTGRQESGGLCGRSRDRGFLCYCPHGTNHPRDCNSGGSKDFRLGINGGYGCVYKGKLLDGHLVVVKILSKLKGDGEDFINEVNSMSITSHVNIVNMLGFYFHKTKRALVYDYMPSGSLEKLIYEKNYNELGCHHLGWGTLYQISLGIAQGLKYLHQGCNLRILPFDIKLHNILLDENHCPKIFDFGPAKICHRGKKNYRKGKALPKKKKKRYAIERRARSHYLAQVFCRNIRRMTQKSDVYTFGMIVLEMVGGRKNIVTRTTTSIRPTTSEVVDILKGNVDCLPVPPKPHLSSPSRSSPTTSMSMVV
ncbi:hypothetical protein EUGRSUZ_B02979 [Eucalyptus grandis]|uniref:Uncharacterized protein n=2 Tax=Eucalyptus grandis TaxID=71139 RepID=A0ACC3LUE1_EUCGR|nr:hypothetical protein EUGRSUZ_B02979 [Eucalyptus grandis]